MFARGLTLSLVLISCGPTQPEEPVQEIAVRKSGDQSFDVILRRTGIGSFEQSSIGPNPSPPTTGTFRLSSSEFEEIEARFAEFRKEAIPLTDASLKEKVKRTCPKGVPIAFHRGAIYIRWVGEGFDQHYLGELGCDYERNANRNAKLNPSVEALTVLTGLP